MYLWSTILGGTKSYLSATLSDFSIKYMKIWLFRTYLLTGKIAITIDTRYFG